MSAIRSRHALIPLLLAAGAAHASVDHTGQLAEEVRIEVPAFHGITPAVALRYSSDGGNGFAGVGWRLETGPTITRVSAQRGVPRGDASDRFLLDGQDLIPCVAGSTSPSCTTAVATFGSSANFFSTRIESYERIRRDATGWTLWRRDGTTLVFASVFASADYGDTYRVATVTDTHGNRVQHTWWCDEACYPDSIRYADRPGFPGAEIRFRREDRSDKLSAGNGSDFFTRTKYRLHAIEVRMHGQLLRAYQLGYTQSLANGASITSTIQQFGRDAIVSSSGVYSAGPTPAMPALALTTPSMASAGTRANTVITNNGLTAMTDTRVPFASHFTGDQVSYDLAYNFDIEGEHPRPHGQTIGDFDGDGRADWLKWSITSKDCTALQLNATLMTKTGKKASVRSNLAGVGPNTSISPILEPCFPALYVADVDGDRRDDLLLIAGGKLRQLSSLGTGSFVAGSAQTWSAANEQRCATGDLDGDNRVDVACTSVVNGTVQLAIARSLGNGAWSITNDPLTGLGVVDIATHRIAMGDFTGDGLGDITIATKAGTTWSLLAGTSDGLGHVAWTTQATTWPSGTSGTLSADDVDGDGKSDVVIVQGSNVFTAFSAKGNTARYRTPTVFNGIQQESLAIGDHDGDGRTDLLLQSTQRWALGHGDGTFAPPPADVALPGCDASLDEVAIMGADLNGDGRSDILCTFDDGTVTLRDRMAGILPGGSAHGWLQADVTGDGITELVYITPLAPRGYRITTVTTETQQRTFYDVTTVPGTQTTFTTLDEPDTQRFLAMDVGSTSGAPDGKADLVLVDEVNGALRIYTFLSTGAGFVVIQDLPGTYGGTDLMMWQPGQIDGDGRGDLIRPVLSGGGIAVESLRARGDGHWDVVASPLKFSGMNLTTPGLVVVDISGDGLSDVIHAQCCNPASGGSILRSLLRNRDGTFAERTMVNWGFFRDLRRLKIGDVNGDGLADLVHLSTTGSKANLQVYASDGNGGFQYRAQTVEVTAGSAEDTKLLEDTSLVRLIDIDGDRRTDFVHVSSYVDNTGQRRTAILTAQAPDSNATAWPVQLAKGLAFAAYDLDPWRWQPWTEPLTGDTGLLYIHPTQSQAYVFRAARDHITRIANGRGGVTNITYSSLWGARTYLPERSLPLVVTAVETRDEAHTPAVSETATYAYGDARYSIELGELGFGWIQRNEPDVRELTYSTLDDQCGARPWKVMQLDPAHAVQSYRVYSYVAPGVVPYTCDRQVSDDYECDATSCRFARSESLTLDEYGNAVAVAVSADRAIATLTYAPPNPNVAAYIVDKPAYVAQYDATSSGPALRSATFFTYDNQPGRLGDLLVAARYDGTSVLRETKYTYFPTGQLSSITDPRNQIDTITYDATYALSPMRICLSAICTDYVTDPVSRLVTQSTDANGAVTTTTYDGHGRIRKVTRPLGGTVETHYLGTGVFTGPVAQRQRTRTEISDGSPGDQVLWSETFFDGLGRTYRTTREGGATVDTRYADASEHPQMTSTTYALGGQPAGWTAFTYDALGRLTVRTAPDTTQRQTQYRVGYQIDRDEKFHPRTTHRDGHGQITQIDELLGATVITTRYERDGAGRIRRNVDHLGHVSTAEYDLLGRQTSNTSPDRGTTQLAYLENDLLASSTDATGQVIRFAYDSAGRIVSREDLDARANVVRTATWQWDTDAAGQPSGFSRGRLVGMTDTQAGADISTTHVYDREGRVTTTTRCIDRTCMPIAQKYDVAGRLASLTYPDARGNAGEVVAHSYDDAGNLSAVGGYASSIGHTLDGQLASLVLGNGVQTTLSYDPARRWLDSAVTTSPVAGTIYAATYTHDAVGRIVGLDDVNPKRYSLGFTYDELGRLVDVDTRDASRREAFSYDPIGRMRWSTTTGDIHYDDRAHVHAPSAADAGFTRRYDTLGNATRISDPDGRALELAWTVDGRLASTADTRSGETTALAYDPSGARVKKQGRTTTLFFGGLAELVDGKLVTYYMAGDRLLARRDSKQVSYYTLDLARSTRVVTDETGAAINRYDYSAYGRVVTSTESVAQDHEHGGARHDDESALTYMNARYYDPALAHFVSADTIIPDAYDPQSFHRYSYAQQDPINFWDPSGHMRASVEYKKELQARGGIDEMVRRAGFLCGSGDMCWSIPIEMMAEIREDARWAQWLGYAAYHVAKTQNAMNLAASPAEAGESLLAGGATGGVPEGALSVEVASLNVMVAAERIEAESFAEIGQVVPNPNWKGVPFLTPEQIAFDARMAAIAASIATRIDPSIDTTNMIRAAQEAEHGTIGPIPPASEGGWVWKFNWMRFNQHFNDFFEPFFPPLPEEPGVVHAGWIVREPIRLNPVTGLGGSVPPPTPRFVFPPRCSRGLR